MVCRNSSTADSQTPVEKRTALTTVRLSWLRSWLRGAGRGLRWGRDRVEGTTGLGAHAGGMSWGVSPCWDHADGVGGPVGWDPRGTLRVGTCR